MTGLTQEGGYRFVKANYSYYQHSFESGRVSGPTIRSWDSGLFEAHEATTERLVHVLDPAVSRSTNAGRIP